MKVILFSIIVFENSEKKIKLCNTKLKFVNYSLILKMMRYLLAKPERKSFKLYQHIYVYKILFKNLNIKKMMNHIFILIFSRYLTYLLIYCAILSKVK